MEIKDMSLKMFNKMPLAKEMVRQLVYTHLYYTTRIFVLRENGNPRWTARNVNVVECSKNALSPGHLQCYVLLWVILHTPTRILLTMSHRLYGNIRALDHVGHLYKLLGARMETTDGPKEIPLCKMFKKP